MINKIVIDDLELTVKNGYLVKNIQDLGYKTKYGSSTILSLHGAVLGDAYLQNKQIAIEVRVVGDDLNSLITRKSELYKRLTINEFGSDDVTVKFVLANNVTVQATGIVKEVKNNINADLYGSADIAFILETSEPFLKSETIYSSTMYITSGGGIAVPTAVPMDMTGGATGYHSITNGGNVFVFPEIYFYGVLTNPVLTNVTTGKQISLTASISTDDTNFYHVDTFNRTVTDHNGSNKRADFSGDFLTLDVGANEFSLSTDTPTENGYVKFVYRYNYISI